MSTWLVVSLGLIFLNILIMGLAIELQQEWSSVPDPLRRWLLRWTHPWVVQRSPIMSRTWPTRRRLEAWYRRRVVPSMRAKRRGETGETPHREAENRTETVSFGSSPVSAEAAIAEALARLIVAEKIKLTDAVRIGMQARSGERYQRASALVKQAVARLTPQVQQPDGTRAPLSYPVTRGGSHDRP